MMERIVYALVRISYVVIVAGGILISLIDLFGKSLASTPFAWMKTSDSLILLFLSFILLIVGYEQLTVQQRTGQQLHNLDQKLDLSIKGLGTIGTNLDGRAYTRQLVGDNQVYEEAKRLVLLAQRRIIATAFSFGSGASERDSMIDAYVQRLQSSKELRVPVRLELILGATEGGRITRERKDRVNTRWQRFTEVHVEQSVQFYVLPALVGLDLLIVDGRHMILGVAWSRGTVGLEYGLLFWDSPEIVGEFDIWLRDTINTVGTLVEEPSQFVVAASPEATETTSTGESRDVSSNDIDEKVRQE